MDLAQFPRNLGNIVQQVNPVDRQPDNARILRQALMDRLPDPPDRMGAIKEMVDRLHRTGCVTDSLAFLQSVLDRESMVIQVHPEDQKHAEHILPELQKEFHEIKNVNFEGHPSIPRGSCIVDTNFGAIEARFDDLHDQIEKILHLAPPNPDAPGPS